MREEENRGRERLRAVAGYLVGVAVPGALGRLAGAFLGGPLWGLAVAAPAGAFVFSPKPGSRDLDRVRRETKQAEMKKMRGPNYPRGGAR